MAAAAATAAAIAPALKLPSARSLASSPLALGSSSALRSAIVAILNIENIPARR